MGYQGSRWAQLAAASQLGTAAVGAAERRDSAPLASASADSDSDAAVVKPYKDWLPPAGPRCTVTEAYSGESDRSPSPKAFLAQYYLYATQQQAPRSESARQLMASSRQDRPDSDLSLSLRLRAGTP
jgi:hypothetical protein